MSTLNQMQVGGVVYDIEDSAAREEAIKLKEEVNQIKDDISEAWVSGKTYAVGDYCISGNRLYKCKTAHTAGSAFNSSYWDPVNVAGEIKNAGNWYLGTVTPCEGITLYPDFTYLYYNPAIRICILQICVVSGLAGYTTEIATISIPTKDNKQFWGVAYNHNGGSLYARSSVYDTRVVVHGSGFSSTDPITVNCIYPY